MPRGTRRENRRSPVQKSIIHDTSLMHPPPGEYLVPHSEEDGESNMAREDRCAIEEKFGDHEEEVGVVHKLDLPERSKGHGGRQIMRSGQRRARGKRSLPATGRRARLRSHHHA
jgi:hypothetical protein